MQKVCSLDAKACGNPNQCVVPWQDLAIFDFADIGTAHSISLRHFKLADSELRTQIAQSAPKLFTGVRRSRTFA
jgi:hypothetical protein